MFYTWKLCFVIEPLSSDQYSKYKQCSFLNADATPMNKHDFHFQPNIKVETALTYQRWINVILSMLFQRCFINVGTTSINIRRVNFHFQPNFTIKTTSTLSWCSSIDVVSTLFCQHWNNVHKCTSAQLSFSTKYQRRNNIDERWRYLSSAQCSILLFKQLFIIELLPYWFVVKNIKNYRKYDVLVSREIWYFRQLRKIKKIWYLRWAFLRKCCFSCSDCSHDFSVAAPAPRVLRAGTSVQNGGRLFLLFRKNYFREK